MNRGRCARKQKQRFRGAFLQSENEPLHADALQAQRFLGA